MLIYNLIFNHKEKNFPKKSFFKLFGEFEQNYFNGVIHILHNTKLPSDNEGYFLQCSLKLAQDIRKRSWGLILEGVSVAVPWELLHFYPSTNANCKIDGHPNSELGYFLSTILGESDFKSKGRSRMGAYKVYFGSKTKNKVSFEGKQLSVVAPPLLKSALKLLCLPGWGTAVDSDLTTLIYKIIQSMSDLPVECLIPSEADIGGSLGHRWDDVKDKMTCTLSVLWKWASFISSNTNHFKPEVLVSTAETDNLKLHFQSIFLWAIFHFSVRLTRSGTPMSTSSFHAHIHCTDCIEPLNEEIIQLSITEDEWSSLTVLNPHPDNPYCWVPSSKFIRKPQGQSFMAPTTVPNLDTSDLQLKTLLTSTTAQEFLREQKLWDTGNWMSKSSRSSHFQIPVGISMKVDPIGLMYEISFLSALHICWVLCGELHSDDQNCWAWQAKVRQALRYIPNQWFLPLNTLYLNVKHIQKMIGHWDTVTAPQGNPPSSHSKAGFFKNIHLAIINSTLFWDKFSSWLSYSGKDVEIITSGMYQHPVFKLTLHSLLEGDLNYKNRFLLHHLREIHQMIDETGL
jgi:hypothetical protein